MTAYKINWKQVKKKNKKKLRQRNDCLNSNYRSSHKWFHMFFLLCATTVLRKQCFTSSPLFFFFSLYQWKCMSEFVCVYAVMIFSLCKVPETSNQKNYKIVYALNFFFTRFNHSFSESCKQMWARKSRFWCSEVENL